MSYELNEEFLDKIPTEIELEESLQRFTSQSEGEDDYERLIVYILASNPGLKSSQVVDKIKEMVTSAIVRNLHSQDLVEVYMDGSLNLSKKGKDVAKELLGEE